MVFPKGHTGKWLEAINYFCEKKLHLRCLTGFEYASEVHLINPESKLTLFNSGITHASIVTMYTRSVFRIM